MKKHRWIHVDKDLGYCTCLWPTQKVWGTKAEWREHMRRVKARRRGR